MRLALYLKYHKRGVHEVSDNEVYDLIFVSKVVPPPPLPPDDGRVGLPRSSIFTEHESGSCYYVRTDRTVLSDDPSAKRRRIRVFSYVADLDKRVHHEEGRRVGAGLEDDDCSW